MGEFEWEVVLVLAREGQEAVEGGGGRRRLRVVVVVACSDERMRNERCWEELVAKASRAVMPERVRWIGVEGRRCRA